MWHTSEIDGHWFQAKVYDEPSHFGINNGRVSKLVICNGPFCDHRFIIYSYDRGLDENKAPAALLNKIMAYLESLPVSV